MFHRNLIQLLILLSFLQIFLIYLLNVKKDYLQVFEIEPIDANLLKIEHRQEVPKYKSDIVVKNVGISSKVKIFVIDDGEYSTMMLSSEY